MKLTAAASYAINAVVHLSNAPDGKLVSNSTISEAHNLPERFVLQILRHLVNSGTLSSVRGVYGGYRLAKPANKITLLEVIAAVGGSLTFGLEGELALAPRANAVIHKAFAGIEDDTRKRLGAVTIADLRSAK